MDASQKVVTLSHHRRIAAALFRHLIDNSAIPLIGSAIGSFLVTLAYLDSPLRKLVFAWIVLVYLTLTIRFWLLMRCRQRLKTHGYHHEASVRYALTFSLSGIAWGMSSLFLLKASPIAMVVTITATQAMVIGGALTLGAFLPAFFAFALPAILPMIIVLAASGGSKNFILAAYSAIFLALIIHVARNLNHSLRHSWRLTFEKEDLLKALTEAHDFQSILAKTDGLTGIANRRRFDEVLEAEINRLQRSAGPLSLLILDVDHFKAFNDTYGHIAGDECLKKIAEVLLKNINRASDLAARYGGEEFVGILPETDLTGASFLAEQVRSDVEALHILHSSSPTSDHVTISLGVVALNGSEVQSSAHAISLADQQLYRAKAEGRNRVAASNIAGMADQMQQMASAPAG
jgi:diguanylate cyclase (GGDEF)-like protein